jgi:maleylacetate reductase
MSTLTSAAGRPAQFTHEQGAQRIRFGTQQARKHLIEEVERVSASRIMLIANDSQRVRAITSELDVALWQREVVEHVPAELAQASQSAAADAGIDLLVSVGGGSATGLAKAIALTERLPIVAVPTTYAGSEATSVWGLTEAGRKTTGTDASVLPRAIVYDAALTLTLPRELSVSSGFNALAHCIDSLWAPGSNPINRMYAAEGVRALYNALPIIARDPLDVCAREQALWAAYVAAVAFASAGSGLHHKICHVLGGMFNLPHAPTHAAVLPTVLAFNAPAAVEALAQLNRAFGTPDAVRALRDLIALTDAPASLEELGMPRAGIPAAVEAILPVIPASNPRQVDRDTLTALIEAAWVGPSTRITSGAPR